MCSGARCALFLVFSFASPVSILTGFLLVILLGSLVYSVLQMIAVQRYLAARPLSMQSAEPVSILKPLAGLDLDLESNLRTFFEQDYPSFEILLAVQAQSDPAASVVARLQREYPGVPSR